MVTSCCHPLPRPVLSTSAPARLPCQPESVRQRQFSPSPSPSLPSSFASSSSSENGEEQPQPQRQPQRQPQQQRQPQPQPQPLFPQIAALLNPNNFLYHITILLLFLIYSGWSLPPPHPRLPTASPPRLASNTTSTNDLALVTLFPKEGYQSARIASITTLRNLDHLISHEQELFLGIAAQPYALSTVQKEINGLIHELEGARSSADDFEGTLHPLQAYLEYLRDKDDAWVETGELSAVIRRVETVNGHAQAGLIRFSRVRERYKAVGERMLAWREKVQMQRSFLELELEWRAWEGEMNSWSGVHGERWVQASKERGGEAEAEEEEEERGETKKMDSMELRSELVYLRLVERDFGDWIRLWREWDHVYVPLALKAFAKAVRIVHDSRLLGVSSGLRGMPDARGSWKTWIWEKKEERKKGVWLRDLEILDILRVSLYK